MQGVVSWLTIIGFALTFLGLIIGFISLFNHRSKLRDMQQMLNIYSKFISNQNVYNIQINSSDMSQSAIADLFKSLKEGTQNG